MELLQTDGLQGIFFDLQGLPLRRYLFVSQSKLLEQELL